MCRFIIYLTFPEGNILTLRSSVSDIRKSATLPKIDLLYSFSVKNQECKTRQHSCYIDVLQLTKDRYVGDVKRKRIATWNGDTVQPCSSEEESIEDTLSPKIKTVFRVPIVEYFPFTTKHELSGFFAKCPTNSLPCYGQQRKRDNTTVSPEELIRFRTYMALRFFNKPSQR